MREEAPNLGGQCFAFLQIHSSLLPLYLKLEIQEITLNKEKKMNYSLLFLYQIEGEFKLNNSLSLHMKIRIKPRFTSISK